MSIYATQWILKFPEHGDAHSRCEWVTILGQGVPDHVGTPTFGHGYESGDLYSDFLPPAVPVGDDAEGTSLRAIVIVREQTEKMGQQYVDPLLTLSGAEYAAMSFQQLHDRICDALRGSRPRLVAEVIGPVGTKLFFEDGSDDSPTADDS